mgnify:CR=1 FL=1
MMPRVWLKDSVSARRAVASPADDAHAEPEPRAPPDDDSDWTWLLLDTGSGVTASPRGFAQDG